jgi:hypothetical protein
MFKTLTENKESRVGNFVFRLKFAFQKFKSCVIVLIIPLCNENIYRNVPSHTETEKL